MKSRKKIINEAELNPLEHEEQCAFFRWAEFMFKTEKDPNFLLLFAIPNEQKAGMKLVRYLKAEGMKPGVPDIFWPVPRHPWHGLFIEMKRRRGGSVTKAQRHFIKALTDNGYYVKIAKGYDMAKEILLRYWHHDI